MAAHETHDNPVDPSAGAAGSVELVVVTMRFVATDPTALGAVLSRYVVLTRGVDGCRNVDLCVAVGDPHRFVVIEKWSSPAAQRAHADGEVMVAMAEGCRGLLDIAPSFELLDGLSAHDLA